MEFIELADYPLPNGRVIEWLPTADSHWADWPHDPRSVSYNHERHLRDALEHSRLRDHRHYWLGHTFRVDGPLDAAAWRVALDLWIDRNEGLRTHVTIEGGRPVRYTRPPGGIRVHPTDAGAPASTMATYRLVQDLLDAGTSPLRWPAYVCVTIGGHDGFTVVLAADHSLMDGYSTVTAGGELRAIYEAVRAGTVPAPNDAGSYLDFSDRERAQAGVTTAGDPAVDTWRRFVAEVADDDFADTRGVGPLSRVAARPVALGTGPSEPAERSRQRNLAIEVLDAASADIAAAAAGEQRQGLFAVLLAAFAATTTELGAGQEFRTVVPLHTRSEPQWADALGWFVGLAPFQLDCGTARSLGDLITPAGDELRRVRTAATVPFGRVCELLDAQPRISFMVSYMDVRSAAAADTWVDTDTRWLRSRNASADEFFFWFIRTPTGVTLNTRYPGSARATRDIHRHVLRMRDLLTEFARYGDAIIRPFEPARPSEGAQLSWR